MRIFIISLIFLLNFTRLEACINLEIAELNRKLFDPSSKIELPQGLEINYENLERKLIEIEDQIDEGVGTILLENNYAGILIYLGRYEEAKLILEINQEEYPEMYSVNANLGTLYELLGLNDEAYNLIQKAINTNNKSHGGTEWIHLKILDLKRKKLDIEEYLHENPIIFIDSLPKYNSLQKIRLKQIGKELEYQLIERMTFIKDKNMIVGRLLFELGIICRILGNYEEGLKIFKTSKDYGFQNDKIDEEINLSNQKFKSIKSRRISNRLNSLKRIVMDSRKLQIMLIVFPILLFFLGYYGIKILRK